MYTRVNEHVRCVLKPKAAENQDILVRSLNWFHKPIKPHVVKTISNLVEGQSIKITFNRFRTYSLKTCWGNHIFKIRTLKTKQYLLSITAFNDSKYIVPCFRREGSFLAVVHTAWALNFPLQCNDVLLALLNVATWVPIIVHIKIYCHGYTTSECLQRGALDNFLCEHWILQEIGRILTFSFPVQGIPISPWR